MTQPDKDPAAEWMDAMAQPWGEEPARAVEHFEPEPKRKLEIDLSRASWWLPVSIVISLSGWAAALTFLVMWLRA
jgi:hypothetical protein